MQLVIATPETRAERLGRDRAIKRGSEHGTAVALIVLRIFLELSCCGRCGRLLREA